MDKPIRLAFLLGTRPEAVKLIPVILEARHRANEFEVVIVSTGQHRELLDGVFEDFGIQVDVDLDLMLPSQDPASFLTRAMDALGAGLKTIQPDCVVVQGDTMTTLAGALAASYQRIPVAHVEAGLRSFDRANPWPEETNRCLVTQVADFHFAPTATSQRHLLNEGVPQNTCWVTGNTGIDALRIITQKHAETASSSTSKTILLTCHRRENFGAPMESICLGILRILEACADVNVLCPVHPNPAARAVIESKLGAHPRVELVEPMGYAAFSRAMADCTLILTDSGGVQEEAPSLGRPVLVLRNTTERPEAIQAGLALLVGTDADRIFSESKHLLEDSDAYAKMARRENPFGDGKASARILDHLHQQLGRGSQEPSSKA